MKKAAPNTTATRRPFTEEEWRPVVNHEGFYEISSFGNFRSLDRLVWNQGRQQSVKGRLLSPHLNPYRGYLQIRLSKNGEKKTRTIHQLVAESFLGHSPCSYKIVVNHIDLDKQNNYYKNLELITQKENSNRKHIPHSSKHFGVTWSKDHKRWVAYFGRGKGRKILGNFINEDEAGNAVQIELLRNKA